jgi:predicted NBD/HSP70 family sugar kinase
MVTLSGNGSQRSLRARNRDLVVRTLSRLGPLAQAEIAMHTTLSRATVSNIVAALTADGMVEVNTGQHSGRQAKIVRLLRGGSAQMALGLAVGRDVITGIACEADGTPILSVKAARAPGATYEEELRVLSRLVTEMQAHPDTATRSPLGVGVALATWVDFDNGCIPPGCDWYGFAADSGWPSAPLRSDLSALVDVPVQVDSDGNAAALAEARWGAGRGLENIVYVRVLEGVSGGLLLNNRLYRGERGLAGSLGHSTADPSGRVCICGSRGCLETYLNPDTLLEPLRHLYGPDLTCSRVATLAAEGDDGCTRIIVDASERLARALANVVSVLVPQCIVVAGDLAPAGAVLTEALERSLKSLMPSMFHPGTVMTGQLGADAAIGAAALIFEEALWSPMDRNGVATGV